MYNQSQHNGSSYPTFDNFPQLTPTTFELDFEAPNIMGCSSSNSSHVGSPSSNHFFERSISNPSLNKGSTSSLLGFTDDSHNSGVRRVCSFGDFESVSSYMARRKQRAESPLSISTENSLIIEGILKATKYTPEEKRERIERYRNKRNQRNFHKKIQYTCRKTLADSRPRIKGRFVKNDEISTSISSTNMMMMDGNCYVLDDQYSSSHDDHQQQQQHMVNEGEELGDECQENSWPYFIDYPLSSQYTSIG